MNVALLHTKDALEPPVDPVLENIEEALRTNNHECRRVVVDDKVEPLVAELTANKPDIVFNLAEAFAGRSALESNVAALLNLLATSLSRGFATRQRLGNSGGPDEAGGQSSPGP